MTKKGLIQFIKFGIVGLTNTAISYGLYLLTILLLRPLSVSWDYLAGSIVGFILSVLWSFYWNNRLVFKVGEGEQRTWWKALLKTYISYGFTGLIVSNILLWVWVSVLGISKYIAPILNLFVTVPLNFLINKYWAFRGKKNAG